MCVLDEQLVVVLVDVRYHAFDHDGSAFFIDGDAL